MSFKIWLYNLIPIIVHISLLPFWFLEKNAGITGLIELAIGVLVIPIYLVIINFKFFDKISAGKFVILLLLMIGINVIGHLISYFNWGLSTGNLLTPDSETVHIIKLAIVASTIILTVGWITACLIKSRTI